MREEEYFAQWGSLDVGQSIRSMYYDIEIVGGG